MTSLKNSYVCRMQVLLHANSKAKAQKIVEKIVADVQNRLSMHGDKLTLMSDWYSADEPYPGDLADDDYDDNDDDYDDNDDDVIDDYKKAFADDDDDDDDDDDFLD